MTRRSAVLGALMGLLALSGCVVVDRDRDVYHYHRRGRRRGRRRRYYY